MLQGDAVPSPDTIRIHVSALSSDSWGNQEALIPSTPTSDSTAILLISLFTPVLSYSQTQVTNRPPSYGPFNAIFLPDGEGSKKPLVKTDSVLRKDSPWSL